MPGPMPYHLEKGPYLTALEDRLNVTASKRVALWKQVADPSVGVNALVPSVEAKLLDKGPDALAARRNHVWGDWYGRTPARPQRSFRTWLDKELGLTSGEPDDVDAVQGILAAPENVAVLGQLTTWPRTGFWQQYYGDVEGICAKAFERAVAVSLGCEGPDDEPNRLLPIEIFWKCPQRWFESWVTWRINEGGGGHVTVILATPGTDSPVLERYENGRDTIRDPEVVVGKKVPPKRGAVAPSVEEHSRGMWAVTQKQNVLLPALRPSRPTASGDWTFPGSGPWYAGVGEVVVVQPSFKDGGMLDDGLPRSAAARVRRERSATSKGATRGRDK